MDKRNVKWILICIIANFLFSFLHGFNKIVEKDVYVGTETETTILDLMTYFPDRLPIEFQAWILYPITAENCPTDFVIVNDMKLKLQNNPTRPNNNSKICLLHIIIWGTNGTVHTLSVTVKYYGCWPDTDDMGIEWEAAMPNSVLFKRCPEPTTGFISRACTSEGKFLDPINNCVRNRLGLILDKLYEQLNQTTLDKANVAETLRELAKSTESDRHGLDETDVEFTVHALMRLTGEKFSKIVKDKIIYTPIFDTGNNLFDVNNTRAWRSLLGKGKGGAEQLMTVMDRTMMHAVTMVTDDDVDYDSDDQPILYQRENLMLSMGSLTGCNQSMGFPDRSYDVMDWVKITRNRIIVPCINRKESKVFSSAYYKNVSKLVSQGTHTSERHTEINSGVMSYTLYPRMEESLQQNIEISFGLYNKEMVNPLCSFWKVNKSTSGYWSTRGCRVKSFETDVVVCSCDHLTNFAILMSPVETPDKHAKILGILSIMGCVVSMIFLMVTIVIYATFWSNLTARNFDGSVVLVNLCGSLFIAYLIFLVGVSQTDNMPVCTVVAVFLHYMFLVVFFTMLAEGVLLLRMVVWPYLVSLRIALKLLIGIWVVPAIIVSVSLGVTRTEGYGNDKFCWLSVKSGLIWSFVGPAVAIIAVNCVVITIVLWKMLQTAAMQTQSDRKKLQYATRSFGILLPLVGITWILGVFSASEDAIAFQYIFVILNTLQGLAIFLCHCMLNKTVRSALKRTKENILISRSQTSKAKGSGESKNTGSRLVARLFKRQRTGSTELVIDDERQPYRSTN